MGRSLTASITGIKIAKQKLEGRSLTQKALAEEMEIASWSTINKFFTGKPIDRRIFIEICEALDLDWEDVVASPQGQRDRASNRGISREPTAEKATGTFGRLGSLIAEKTQGFVGREYVFSAIAEFLRDEPNGYFILQADPGVGKSAILAKYVEQNDCLAYFNERSRSSNRAAQFLESLCTQLIERYDLSERALPPEATTDGNFLAQLLEGASRQLGENEKLVVAVDALDEVDLASQDSTANILYLPADLPRGVYFILTQRPATLPLVVRAPQRFFNLMQYSQESLQDVRDYIRRATQRVKLRLWLEQRQLESEDFVVQLARQSENNFMYLRYVLPEIERGFYQDLSIESLPKGLEGYYEDHWRRMGMTVKPLPRTKLKIVYILGEIRQPASRGLIAEYAEEDQLSVQEVLDEWQQFLHEQDIDSQTCYSIYHASFQDFLHRKDIVQAVGVDLQEINAAIAQRLWEGLFGDV